MNRQARVIVVMAGLALGVIPTSRAQQPVARTEAPPVFSRPQSVTHPYLPLASLQQDTLEGRDGKKALRIVRIVRSDLRKSVKSAGQTFETLVIQSRTYSDGRMTSVATEYFAQADNGSVYVLGRVVDEYANREVTGHAGSWMLAEGAGTLPVAMPSKAVVGEKLAVAEVAGPNSPAAEVASLSETVTTPAGTFSHCLKIRSQLPDGRAVECYYAQGVGCVKEAWDQGEVLLTASATLTAYQALAAARAADPKATDPLARVALRSVGADPRANQYWIRAINNTALSPRERKNLIEDLNEDGLSDPKHPTQKDLPLILSRIRLIETLAPYSMDQVNADAFQEAYKDLVKMVRDLTGQAGAR